MNRLLNAWRPMLLGAILMLVLVGVAGAVPTDRPNALSTRRQLMLSGSDFVPCDHNVQYSNFGGYVQTTSGGGYFVAPVNFPYPLWVTIDKFELFAYDNNSGAQISTNLYFSKPPSFSEQNIGGVETGVAYASATNGTWSTTTISPKVKNPADDVYIYAYISSSTELKLYGVRIFYYMGK